MTGFRANERDGRVSSVGTWISGIVAFGLILIGVILILGLGSGHGGKNSQHLTQLKPVSARVPAFATRSIEDMRVGDRVLAGNPEGSVAEPEVDPATWRKITLVMRKQGIDVYITLLRRREWIDAHTVTVGGTVELNLPELDATGPAKVSAVGPCPPLKPGTGRVVTGTFAHDDNGTVLDLRLEGLAEPIGVTANHPVWSEDRQAFVKAGELKVGERLRPLSGRTRVASLTPRRGTHRVYNLEVAAEHAYRVSSLGVLVHNNCETVSIWKAPQPGLGKAQLNNGYINKNFPGGAYFAKTKSLANQYASHYGEGIIEVKIPKSSFDKYFSKFERPYQGGPDTELLIPEGFLNFLNDVTLDRIFHP